MPDFYTRVHAASITDTIGFGLLLLGMMLQAGLSLVTAKLAIIGLLIFFVSPDGDARARQGGHDARRQAAARPATEGAIEALIVNVLLALMAVVALAIVVQRNLFAVVVLGGAYSFLMATVLVALDAVDVAMTEASVGAGISTVLLLAALHLCGGDEAKPFRRPALPLVASVVIGGLLVYGTFGLPAFSDPRGADPSARRAALHQRRGARDRACRTS